MYVDINAAGCPNTCRHCSADGHMPFGSLFSLDELRQIQSEWGPLTIRFEPTAHPDFPEIYHADIAIDHGGWLVTNGFGLANRADYPIVLTKMGAIGLHTVAFTLHGLREHHDWFVCKAGAYDDILLATRRTREAGFSIVWQIFVDKKGVADIPALIEIALKACGELPSLQLPCHRVGGRLWHYEHIRLTLKDVKTHRLDRVIEDKDKNIFSQPESLTAGAWLEKWHTCAEASDFMHPFEPRSWPPKVASEQLSLRITRDRKIYFDPFCSPPIYLGSLTAGKTATVERIENLPAPRFSDLKPDEVRLSPEEQEQLHPQGCSLRYKEISKKRLQ